MGVLALLGLTLGVPVRAQVDQFLPEVNVNYRLESWMRFEFQAKETREAGGPTQVELGPSVSFFVKPLFRLRGRVFDPDGAESRLLQIFAGYRWVPSPDKPTIQRMEVGFTSNFPFVGGFYVSDRSRFDLDWSLGIYRWRYRNRVMVRHRIRIGNYRLEPYAQAEFYFQSQYEKWATTALSVGSIFPISKRVSLDFYYQHQNITGKRPNQQLDQLGVRLDLYFIH